jgi:hypothetical protein
MSKPFLDILPREIRDQIYVYVLTSATGTVGLSPWTHHVAKSLSIMRTCKQIQREVKDTIWKIHDLKLRESTMLEQRFTDYAEQDFSSLRHIQIDLEIMDRDELEWIIHGLRVIASSHMRHTVKLITLRTIWERPRDVKEYKEVLNLRKDGHACDGRLVQEHFSQRSLLVNTGWPRFSHWGKQKWLKEMLLDPSGDMLQQIHDVLGGDMYVDKVLVWRDGKQVRRYQFNPRDSVVDIVPEIPALKRRPQKYK